MNWSIIWKVLLANFVIVAGVVLVLQKLLWPADEWICRKNTIWLNRAVVEYNRDYPEAKLVEHLTERDPETGKTYIDQVLVSGGYLKSGVIVNPIREEKNGQQAEAHYYYLGEVARSWDLYYVGLRVTRQTKYGPKTLNVSTKCTKHDLNPLTIEMLGVLILTGILSFLTWQLFFTGYVVRFMGRYVGFKRAQ